MEKVVFSFIFSALIALYAIAPQAYTLEDFCKFDGSPYIKINNPEAVNVPLNTLIEQINSFLDEFDFSTTPSNCGHYCETAHNYLEDNGIKTAMVIAKVAPRFNHCFNCSYTTDHGLVYFDLTDGHLSIGEKVNGRYVFTKNVGNMIQTQEVGDARDFIILW